MHDAPSVSIGVPKSDSRPVFGVAANDLLVSCWLWSLQATRMIMCHMCKEPFEVFWWPITLLVVCIGNTYLQVRRALEETHTIYCHGMLNDERLHTERLPILPRCWLQSIGASKLKAHRVIGR